MQNGNEIGDRGAEMIGEGLKVNNSLRELHLVMVLFFKLGQRRDIADTLIRSTLVLETPGLVLLERS
jgi:hypothetical protein